MNSGPLSIRSGYIEDLKVAGDALIHYDELFERAIENVLELWGQLAEGLTKSDAPIFARLGNWNLDTGKDTHTGSYVYWEVA